MGRRIFKPRNGNSRRPGFSQLIWLVGLGGVILLGLIAAFAVGRGGKTSRDFTPEATGGAKLKADQELIDLGDVHLGQTVAIAFELTNVGDQPLQFTEPPYVEVVEGC